MSTLGIDGTKGTKGPAGHARPCGYAWSYWLWYCLSNNDMYKKNTKGPFTLWH